MTTKKENATNVQGTTTNKKTNKNTVTTKVVGLETPETNVETPDYTNIEYLTKTNPVFSDDVTSSKYDPKREPKVQEGLNQINELVGDKINPLVILLAKWWEVKPARAEIKKMIDAEAEANNCQKDMYLQTNLKENISKLATIQSAVDRAKYAINYFKPRNGIKASYQQLKIDNKTYNVDLLELAKAKETYGDDKKAIKKYLIKVSKEIVIQEL